MVRPGRCPARIEVGALTRAEAVGRLGRDAVGGEEAVGRDGATLAELYALRRGTSPTSLPEPRGGADAGPYL